MPRKGSGRRGCNSYGESRESSARARGSAEEFEAICMSLRNDSCRHWGVGNGNKVERGKKKTKHLPYWRGSQQPT